MERTYTLAGPCVTMSGFADALGEVFQRHPRLLRIPARAASALAAAARVLPLPIYPDQVAACALRSLRRAPKPSATLSFDLGRCRLASRSY